MRVKVELSNTNDSDASQGLWSLKVLNGEQSKKRPPLAHITRITDGVMQDAQALQKAIWLTAEKVWERHQLLDWPPKEN